MASAAPGPADDGATARALAVPSRRALLAELVGSDGPRTIADLATSSGLHHTTVRSHVLALTEAGLVRTSVEERHTRGHPRTLVEPTAEAVVALGAPGPYERLAVMLATVTRTGAAPADVGRAVGLVDADRFEAPVGIDDLERELRRQGFAPHIEQDGTRTRFVLDRCPFAEAAELDPATICALHEGWAHGFLDGTPDVAVEALRGAPPRHAGCVLTLRPRPPA